MRNLSKLVIGSCFLIASVPASAAMYTFSFTPSQALFGTPYSGSGTFTTSDTAMTVGGQTAFTITGVSGIINNSAVTNPVGGAYGNYFTTGGYFLDGSGVNISLANGTTLNFFNQSSNNLYRINNTNSFVTFYVNASSSAAPAAVPEPASWAMMLAGFGAVGAAMRRRQQISATFGSRNSAA